MKTNEQWDYSGETTLSGFIVGWSGQARGFEIQSPKIRVKPGSIEIRTSLDVSYIVAHIAYTEDGETIHHVILNPREKGG